MTVLIAIAVVAVLAIVCPGSGRIVLIYAAAVAFGYGPSAGGSTSTPNTPAANPLPRRRRRPPMSIRALIVLALAAWWATRGHHPKRPDHWPPRPRRPLRLGLQPGWCHPRRRSGIAGRRGTRRVRLPTRCGLQRRRPRAHAFMPATARTMGVDPWDRLRPSMAPPATSPTATASTATGRRPSPPTTPATPPSPTEDRRGRIRLRRRRPHPNGTDSTTTSRSQPHDPPADSRWHALAITIDRDCGHLRTPGDTIIPFAVIGIATSCFAVLAGLELTFGSPTGSSIPVAVLTVGWAGDRIDAATIWHNANDSTTEALQTQRGSNRLDPAAPSTSQTPCDRDWRPSNGNPHPAPGAPPGAPDRPTWARIRDLDTTSTRSTSPPSDRRSTRRRDRLQVRTPRRHPPRPHRRRRRRGLPSGHDALAATVRLPPARRPARRSSRRRPDRRRRHLALPGDRHRPAARGHDRMDCTYDFGDPDGLVVAADRIGVTR